MKGEKKDIPIFQEEICKKECILKGKCIEQKKEDSWYFACPHYFNWKIGFRSFVADNLKYNAEHEDEVKEKGKKVSEIMKEKRKSEKKKATE